MSFSVPEFIRKTRDREDLTKDEIELFVRAIVDGTAQPSQIGAWLMAVYLQGLSKRATADLTLAMRNSGHQMKWPAELPVGDKHSTGGVGDKISIILAPALAVCGAYVPMISARGLGHTGGTVDKLESIPGFVCAISPEEIEQGVKTHGVVITCQSKQVAPADSILYRTRDVTATVPSIPLITASILSKKLSAGLRALVMDVKFGRAAFMKTLEEAQKLAQSIQSVATACDVKTASCLTRMDVPIGSYVGNSLETFECLVALKNGGIQRDLLELVLTEGACLLVALGLSKSVEEGKQQMQEAIRSGKAYDKFKSLCRVHHVSEETIGKFDEISHFEDLYSQTLFALAKYRTPIHAARSGFIADIHAFNVGLIAFELGAGRTNSEAAIDPAVGFVLLKHVGDAVQEGETWCELHHQDLAEGQLQSFITRMQDSVTIVDKQPVLEPFVKEIFM